MRIRPRNLLANTNNKIIIPDIDEDKTQESAGKVSPAVRPVDLLAVSVQNPSTFSVKYQIFS